MAARYRDRDTGKFVSKETWTRSKAQGGTRFKREYAKRPEPPAKRLPEPQRLTEEELEELLEEGDIEVEEIEYEGAFDSP